MYWNQEVLSSKSTFKIVTQNLVQNSIQYEVIWASLSKQRIDIVFEKQIQWEFGGIGIMTILIGKQKNTSSILTNDSFFLFYSEMRISK